MNVAFYIPVLNVGGAEKVILNLLKQLSDEGNNKYFLITDIAHSSWIDELDPRVAVLDIDSETSLLIRLKKIKIAINLNNIQLIVSHLTHSNLHCLLLKFFYKFNLIVVEHNITSQYIDDLPKGRGVIKLLIKRLFKKADRIICVSQATKTDLIEHFNLPDLMCQVIYNPFDFERIRSLCSENLPAKFTNMLNNRRFIVAVARLEIQKNHLFLLDAIKDYLIANDIVLVFVGGGTQEKAIRSMIKDFKLNNHVFLTGYESNPYPYIYNANLLVHPARFEGFGLVLVESVYLGTEVISMNFDTAYEILEGGKLGVICEDKTSMLAAINQKLSEDSKNKGFSKKMEEKFNLKVIAHRYSEAMSAVFNGR